jgi:hypothetical protein
MQKLTNGTVSGASNSGAFVPKNPSVAKSARTKAVRDFTTATFRKKVAGNKKQRPANDGNWQDGDNKMGKTLMNTKSYAW